MVLHIFQPTFIQSHYEKEIELHCGRSVSSSKKSERLDTYMVTGRADIMKVDDCFIQLVCSVIAIV